MAIHKIRIGMFFIILSFSDGPTGFLRVPFAPPTIQYAYVENTVYCGFHTGRAAGFQRSPGGIEPHIRPLNQKSGHMDIIIFQKDNFMA